MVTTKKIAVDYTQKHMRRNLNSFTIKKKQVNTKEDINTGNLSQKHTKVYRKKKKIKWQK